MQEEKQFASVVISSRIRLARNFSNIPFPTKLVDERAFSTVMKSVFEAVKKQEQFKIFTMETMPVESRYVLFEKHLISRMLVENPSFSAVILSDNEEISIMLNEEDHIREQCILSGFKLFEAYNRLNKIDDEIINLGSMAYDKELGFLTACPTNIGTGLRASAMLFLPALSMLGKMEEVQEVVNKLGLTIRGALGEGSRSDGYIYQISNQISLGSSEGEIIKSVESTVKRICEIELNARIELLKQNEVEIKDVCLRAYGIVSNSFTMSSVEFNNLIAKVKLGEALGIIKLKNKDIISSLTKIVQPYTLMEVSKKQLSGSERDIFRAEYLRKILMNALED